MVGVDGQGVLIRQSNFSPPPKAASPGSRYLAMVMLGAPVLGSSVTLIWKIWDNRRNAVAFQG